MPFRAHLTRTHKQKVQLAMEVCAYLNELVEADPQTMYRMVETRFRCNEALTDHPTAQVDVSSGTASIGLLGIINGLIGADADQWGYMAALYGSNLELEKFILVHPIARCNCNGQVEEAKEEALEGS